MIEIFAKLFLVFFEMFILWVGAFGYFILPVVIFYSLVGYVTKKNPTILIIRKESNDARPNKEES